MEASIAEQPLQNSWHCVFVMWAICVTGAGVITNSFVIMNPITPAIKRTYAEIHQERYAVPLSNGTWTTLLALTMSMLYAGGTVGSLLVTPLLRRLTRKQTLCLTYFINSIGLVVVAVGAKAVHSYEMVICGRFIAGISSGLGQALFPLVVNEYSVPHKRLYYGAIYGALYGFTCLISTIIAWPKVLGRYENYIGALIFGLVYPLVFFLCMYWIPETPYQALLKNDMKKALSIQRKLRTGSEAAFTEMEKSLSRSSNHETKKRPEREATWVEIFTISQYRKHFIAVVILLTYLAACGLSNVLSYSNKIFTEAGLPNDAITPASMGLYGVSAVFSVIGVVAMRKFDPKTQILFWSCGLAISHALMTASLQTSHQVPSMSWVSLAAMWLFMGNFSATKTLTLGVVGVLCLDKTRSKSFMVGTTLFWIVGWLVGFIAPYLTEWIEGYSFLVWLTVTVLCMIYIFFCVPKTRNRSEDEIQAFFKK